MCGLCLLGPLRYIMHWKGFETRHTCARSTLSSLSVWQSMQVSQIYRRRFYRMEVELETLMRASFPKPGYDKKLRELLVNNVGNQRLGVRVQHFNNEIRIAYPIALVAGER